VLRGAIEVFLVSRLLVGACAVFAVLAFTPTVPPDAHVGVHPFGHWFMGGFLDLVLSPFAQWDAGWYLTIAQHGYSAGDGAGAAPEVAFFPLYPIVVAALGAPLGSSQGALVVAAGIVSLSALLGALYLLHRLVATELGDAHAKAATMLLAFFPGSLYFSAHYAESLFLLLSVGVFYAARTNRWAWAAALAGLASACRVIGIVLVVPLAIMWWSQAAAGPPPSGGRSAELKRRLRPSGLWLLLAPAGVLAYSAYLGVRFDRPLAWQEIQRDYWGREFSFPLATLWEGARAAVDSVQGIADRATGEHPAGLTYDAVTAHDAINVMEVGFAFFAVVGLVGVFRRLPLAYGAYTAAALVLVWSSMIKTEPLVSLHRHLAVLFPLFIWLSIWTRERGIADHVLAVSAAMLGVFTVMFASGHWLV
jgi:hypothetical protein